MMMNIFSLLLQSDDGDDEYQQQRLLSSSHHAEEWHRHVRTHGTLMIVSWGFCLPVAMASSLLLRHRNQHPSYPFLKFHYFLAGIGVLLLALPGWIIALQNFHVFNSLINPKQATTSTNNNEVDGDDDSHSISNKDSNTQNNNVLSWTTSKMSHTHAVLGMIVMCGAILNILLYPILMSKPKRANESFQRDFSLKRKIGHMTHRIMGHVIIVLGLVTCWTGTRVTHSVETNAKFLKGFIGALIGSSCVAVIFWIDKLKFRIRHRPGDRGTEEGTTTSSSIAAGDDINKEYPNESSVLLA